MIRGALMLAALLSAGFSAAATEGLEGATRSWSAPAVVAANSVRRGARPMSKRDRSEPAGPAATIPPLPLRKSLAGVPEAVAETWTEEEIAEAKARCDKHLKDIAAEVIPHPPIKEGQCGAPAPIRLVSLGKKPQVSFSPPALVTCELAAELNTWIKNDLQPLALKHLGEPIAKIEVMSDYSCRTAFGRVGHKLSEHAFVNALDIRGFVTESGKTAHVLDAWGTTKRDLAAQVAAAKEAAQAEAAARAAADKTAQRNLQDEGSKPAEPQPPTTVASQIGTPGAGLAKRTRAGGIERITVTLPGAPPRKPLEIAARLGGPTSSRSKDDPPAKVAALAPPSLTAPEPGPRARFLRAAHAAACRLFGTTLGPEANEDHRNHFHVDMAERRYKKICD